jgi:hypothetical protein
VLFSETDFIGHSVENIDITVMNLSETFDHLTQAGTPPYYIFLTENSIPTQEDIDKFISPVEDIIFVGYPNGMWDKNNLMPIVRKGITATPYYIPFEGLPIFLIDASVFPGSSGSHFFIYYSGSYPDKIGNLHIGSKMYFLGS